MVAMATGVEEITQAALTLTERERAALASALLESLDEPAQNPGEVQEAWTAEIGSRVDELVSGRVKTVPLAEVKAHLAADRAARRR